MVSEEKTSSREQFFLESPSTSSPVTSFDDFAERHVRPSYKIGTVDSNRVSDLLSRARANTWKPAVSIPAIKGNQGTKRPFVNQMHLLDLRVEVIGILLVYTNYVSPKISLEVAHDRDSILNGPRQFLHTDSYHLLPQRSSVELPS